MGVSVPVAMIIYIKVAVPLPTPNDMINAQIECLFKFRQIVRAT